MDEYFQTTEDHLMWLHVHPIISDAVLIDKAIVA